MLVKHLVVALAKTLEQPRRALDIAEQQRDCAGRKRHRPKAIVSRRPRWHKTASVLSLGVPLLTTADAARASQDGGYREHEPPARR